MKYLLLLGLLITNIINADIIYVINLNPCFKHVGYFSKEDNKILDGLVKISPEATRIHLNQDNSIDLE